MQNRYVGDIGDYVKYALLRAVTETNKLGVIWYLYPNENHNDDGTHTQYLEEPERWLHYDPKLFCELKYIVKKDSRSVQEVNSRNILPGAIYIEDMLCCREYAQRKSYCDACSNNKACHACLSLKDRESWREAWFDRAFKKLEGCKIVFADPDNGFCLGENFRISQPRYWKRLPLQEAFCLAHGRTAILYHHNSMFRGGHFKEIEYWLSELPQKSMALYFNAYNCRTFFIVNPTEDIRKRTQSFVESWSKHVRLFPKGHTSRRLKAVSEDGDVNVNGQKLIRKTMQPSPNHYNQRIWILRCTEDNCNHEYGANGCDFHDRKCPRCQGGKPGFE
jgi:hypothetical protein